MTLTQTPTPNPHPNQAEFLNLVLLRGTSFGEDDGLLLQIRELQRPQPRGHTAAAAVLAADPLNSNGVSRRQALAQCAAAQRWGQAQHQRHAVVQDTRAAERVRERDAREAELEEPGAVLLAATGSPCDLSSLGVEEDGGGVSSARATPTASATPAPAQAPDALTPPTDATDVTRAKAAQTIQQQLRRERACACLQQQRLAEVPGQITSEERAQLTEALDDGEQAVAELQRGGSPACASRRMALQQKSALGTWAKQRLTGDAHASLTGGKPLSLLRSERLFSDAPPLPQPFETEVPEWLRLRWRATSRGIGCLERWSLTGPAAQASRVADAMTRAAHMRGLNWRGGLLGKRTREAVGLPGKLSEYEGRLCTWEHEARAAAVRAAVFCNAELLQSRIFSAVIGIDPSATSGWEHQLSPDETVAGTRRALRVLQCVCKSWRDAMRDFRLSLPQREAAKTARAAVERNLQTDARGERQDERAAEAGAVSAHTPAATQPTAPGSTVTTIAAAVPAAPAASATPESAAIGGDDMENDAINPHTLPGPGNLNPSPLTLNL